MLPTPDEIKEKLLRALDDKNDVDAAVLEMVSVLEKYPITRTTLEETKIGKMVNDLRRKIKDEKLAKRAKQLVRNWKKLLEQTTPVNGSPGLLHPAITQLQSSPAVSPALSRTPGAGRLVSPAQVRGRPHTPTLNAQQNVSPAMLGNKSGAVGGRKGISPAMGGGRPATPTVINAQRVASPALPGGRPKSAVTPSASSRLSSPAVSGRVASPAVSGRVSSPAVSGRGASSAALSRVSSPSLSSLKGQPSPLVKTSPVQSPAMRSTTPVASALGRQEDFSSAHTKHRPKSRVAATASENSHLGGRVTPSSLHSENSQDRVLGETDNGRLDSDGESSCSSSRTGQSRCAYSRNHSPSASLTNYNNKNYGKDQRELSKTNVANRKRTREKSNSPPDETHKKSKLESSSLSFSSHRQDKVINGYTSRSGKKHLPVVDAPGVFSASSLLSVHKHVSSPQMPSALNNDNAALSKSNSLFRQESSDSRLSAQSSDRPSWDKNKVKTTEQLIEDLQKKNNSSKVGNNIMTQLRTNQIEKERDVPGSVLPAGVKPRGKRWRRGKNDINPSVPSSDVTLSQAKNELVERFLKTSDPRSPVGDYSPFKDDLLPDPADSALGVCSSSYSKDNFDGGFSASRQDRSESAPKDESSMDAISPALPSTSQSERTGSALTVEEIYAQLPPINYDIDWDAVDYYELPERKPVNNETVQCLHTERQPGVNGLYDINGDWCPWQQTITLPSYEGNQLHILPYVDLDN